LDFVVLNNSQIRADAFGGPGGNIDIFANVYLTSDSVVSASSALGVPGTIEIQATVTDVSGGLVQLPEAVLQAATLLRASCAARLAEGKASSLVLAGRDGLPLEPSGLLPSPLLSAGAAGAPPSRSEEHWWEMVPRFAWSVLNPQCSR
jgi:large exoprotein involved in heme utilization and adhesion